MVTSLIVSNSAGMQKIPVSATVNNKVTFELTHLVYIGDFFLVTFKPQNSDNSAAEGIGGYCKHPFLLIWAESAKYQSLKNGISVHTWLKIYYQTS